LGRISSQVRAGARSEPAMSSGAQGRRMQPPARSSSYYAVLGVRPGASAAEIRAAYHRLAMVSH